MAKVQPTPDDPRFKDLTGRRFGHWFVVGHASSTSRGSFWHCICRCGTTRVVRGSRLLGGSSKSCKCGHGLTLKECLLARRKIDSATGCWMWDGQRLPSGYGLYCYKKRPQMVHRLSYQAFVGPVPRGMFVCHHCDRPSCFRPECLFLGTRRDNTDDMLNKERQARGERQGSAKLTEQQVVSIRRMIDGGYSQKEIASEFDISQMTVCRIGLRRIWKHVK